MWYNRAWIYYYYYYYYYYRILKPMDHYSIENYEFLLSNTKNYLLRNTKI